MRLKTVEKLLNIKYLSTEFAFLYVIQIATFKF